MLELVKAGGWPMIPLILLSVVALAIIVERFWSLRRKVVIPPTLGAEVRAWAGGGDRAEGGRDHDLAAQAPEALDDDRQGDHRQQNQRDHRPSAGFDEFQHARSSGTAVFNPADSIAQRSAWTGARRPKPAHGFRAS